MNRDWEKLGEEITKSVQDAIDSQDFSRLNQSVTNTVNAARDQIQEAIRMSGAGQKGAPTRPNGANQRSAAWQQNAARAAYLREKQLYANPSGQKAGAVVLTVLGSLLGGSMGVGAILFLITMAVFEGAVMTGIIGAGMFGVGAAVGIGLVAAGMKKFGLLHRFQAYRRRIGRREYCDVNDLCTAIDKPKKFVLKDLEKMIGKGWFRQGRLDKERTCLMVSDQSYRQYRQLEQHMQEQKQEEERVRMENEKYSPKVQEVLKEGERCLKEMRECNDAIPGEEISAKISRIEMLTARIFDRVKSDPDSVDDIQRMMEYYLPTTIKLLRAYEEMDGQPVQGENILSAKKEIEDTLDTLNVAFENLLDSLFQEKAWDVSADISVLNTMLKQEGLGKKDF